MSCRRRWNRPHDLFPDKNAHSLPDPIPASTEPDDGQTGIPLLERRFSTSLPQPIHILTAHGPEKHRRNHRDERVGVGYRLFRGESCAGVEEEYQAGGREGGGLEEEDVVVMGEGETEELVGWEAGRDDGSGGGRGCIGGRGGGEEGG